MHHAAENYVEHTILRQQSKRITQLRRELTAKVLKQSKSKMLESQGTSKFLNNKMTGDHSGFLSGMAPKHPDNSVSNMDSSVHYMFDEVDSSKILHDNNAILPRKRSDITPKSQIIQNEDLDENYIGNVHLPLRNEENLRAEIDTPAMKELYSVLKNLTKSDRLMKAARHLKDAMYLRPLRHDLDRLKHKKMLNFCYNLQTHPLWQSFLFLMSWMYLIMTFWEPAYSGQDDYYENNQTAVMRLLGLEITIILIFSFELGIEIYHRKFDRNRSFKDKYLINMKMVSKIILWVLFVTDCIAYYTLLPKVIFRFSRPFRPACLALYQKQLRRTVTGIIQSAKEMFDIMIFFFLILLVYAVIGVRLIGDLEGTSSSYDKYVNNFSNFGVTLNNMYILLTRDNYPSIMIPAYQDSGFYLLYFIPFLIIDILLLFPIPIAIMFEAFRNHRGKLVIKDRIKEREALFACFICLDEDL